MSSSLSLGHPKELASRYSMVNLELLPIEEQNFLEIEGLLQG